MKTDWTGVAATIRKHRKAQKYLHRIWYEPGSHPNQLAWKDAVKAEKEAVAEFHEAFYQATKHVNHRDNVALLRPDDEWVLKIMHDEGMDVELPTKEDRGRKGWGW